MFAGARRTDRIGAVEDPGARQVAGALAGEVDGPPDAASSGSDGAAVGCEVLRGIDQSR